MRTVLLCLALSLLLVVSVSAETLILPATNLTGVYSSPLNAGQLYEFTVVGTFVSRTNPLTYQDAHCFSSDGWLSVGYVPRDAEWQGTVLRWDEAGISYSPQWTAYSQQHTYSTLVTGKGSNVRFWIYDSVYQDNTGSLTVVVTPVPEPSGILVLFCGFAGLGGMTGLRYRKPPRSTNRLRREPEENAR